MTMMTILRQDLWWGLSLPLTTMGMNNPPWTLPDMGESLAGVARLVVGIVAIHQVLRMIPAALAVVVIERSNAEIKPPAENDPRSNGASTWSAWMTGYAMDTC